MKSLFFAAVITVSLAGCAYTSNVPSANGAAEVMPSRRIATNAYVRVEPELAALTKRLGTGAFCVMDKYTVNIGAAITESIMQTMGAAFKDVSRADSAAHAQPGSYYLDFYLSDFSPRLQFIPGFWSSTAESNVELAIRVRATDPQGHMVLQTTAQGQGYAETSGGCAQGQDSVTEASRKAVQRTMEDLADKLINNKALTEP